MSELFLHGFGDKFSRTAVAQAGLAGMTTVLFEPQTQMAAAFYFNGRRDPHHIVNLFRPYLCSLLDGYCSASMVHSVQGGASD